MCDLIFANPFLPDPQTWHRKSTGKQILGSPAGFVHWGVVVRGGINNCCFTFSQKGEGGGGLAYPKNPYQKILIFLGGLPNLQKFLIRKELRWSKKGEGDDFSFLTKTKKEPLFMPPLRHRMHVHVSSFRSYSRAMSQLWEMHGSRCKHRKYKYNDKYLGYYRYHNP